jgi:hypothetical protein
MDGPAVAQGQEKRAKMEDIHGPLVGTGIGYEDEIISECGAERRPESILVSEIRGKEETSAIV